VGEKSTETPLQKLLLRAVEAAGQKQAAAKALGITPSRFSRLFNAAPGSYSLNVQNCFRLARLIGEPPQAVLRLVGKADLADAIEEYYGRQKPRVVAQTAPPDPLLAELEHLLADGASRQFAEALLHALRETTLQRPGGRSKHGPKSARSA
jgi:plasmid maintenance system antidote protein VapI